MQRRSQGNQHRWCVTNGRTIGDIAANRSRGPHRRGPDAADHFADIGINRGEKRFGTGIGRRCANGNMRAFIGDSIKPPGPADMDDLRQGSKLLGNPKPHVGCANNRGIGMVCIEPGEFSNT